MFLSKAAITKQLFYEFLNFKTLALAPGKPVELRPGTLLGSSLKEDLGLSIEFAEQKLRAHLDGEEATQGEREQFKILFSSLIAYKRSSNAGNNPFSIYAETDASIAHPCAWSVFAPLLIEANGSTLSYETKPGFIDYLCSPKVGFHFDKNVPVEQTGLYIAVQTKNYQMVEAFLCPEFYGYHLTKEDLKKLLSLTKDAKTRTVLFRHSKELLTWISADRELQVNCVLSFEELTALWSDLSSEQRKEFIKNTNSRLWLRLLDKDLGKQKIEKLLGADFSLLNAKLIQDSSIKNKESLPKTLDYLSRNQQFSYLLNGTALKKLFPLPRGPEWTKLLSALGYQLNEERKLTITRYVLPEVLAKIHNQLISILISLPIEAQVIIDALEKIETYIHQPKTKVEYQEFLNRIAKDVVQKEYEQGFFIINWINKLFRYLKIKHESPLHPYLDRLAQAIKEEPVTVIPGELMSILPVVKDYQVYREALSAYFEYKIDAFWLNLPAKEREKIVQEPIQFEALVRFLSAPIDHRSEFFKGLDKDSLSYFNTPQGLKQLVLDTPSCNAARDLPLLITAMKAKEILFLEDVPNIIELLLNSNEEVFTAIYPFFPFQSNNNDSLLFQESVLEALPKPLQKEHFNRFLQAYCANANDFSALLIIINNSNPLLVSQCWDNVPDSMWGQWYGALEHAVNWSQILKHLELSDRLEFFEKLTSGGKLTADEFCEFLLEKNEAAFITLWSKVPEPQWSTWLKDNTDLPSTTLSLLNTMPYPLRVQFFKAMLKMTPAEISSLCVTPDKTIEQFYPQDVATKMVSATTVSDAKAKLHKLKENKHHEFDDGLQELIKAVDELNGQLKEIQKTNIKAHNDWSSYATSFFKTDPYYGLVSSISASKAVLNKLCEKNASHPLLAVVKSQMAARAGFTKLDRALHESREHLKFLHTIAAEMPANLYKEFVSLELIFNKIEAINSLPSGAKVEQLAPSTVENEDRPLAMAAI